MLHFRTNLEAPQAFIEKYSFLGNQGIKNRLRTFQAQKRQKFKNSQPRSKFPGSYKKKERTRLRMRGARTKTRFIQRHRTCLQFSLIVFYLHLRVCDAAKCILQ